MKFQEGLGTICILDGLWRGPSKHYKKQESPPHSQSSERRKSLVAGENDARITRVVRTTNNAYI